MKSLTLKKLEEDKAKLGQLIQQTQQQLIRLDGALAYITDNIKKLKEVEDVRTRTNNKKPARST